VIVLPALRTLYSKYSLIRETSVLLWLPSVSGGAVLTHLVFTALAASSTRSETGTELANCVYFSTKNIYPFAIFVKR
jgi:hypothetical protein